MSFNGQNISQNTSILGLVHIEADGGRKSLNHDGFLLICHIVGDLYNTSYVRKTKWCRGAEKLFTKNVLNLYIVYVIN